MNATYYFNVRSILILKIVGEIYDAYILHTITSTATEIDYVEHEDNGC